MPHSATCVVSQRQHVSFFAPTPCLKVTANTARNTKQQSGTQKGWSSMNIFILVHAFLFMLQKSLKICMFGRPVAAGYFNVQIWDKQF